MVLGGVHNEVLVIFLDNEVSYVGVNCSKVHAGAAINILDLDVLLLVVVYNSNQDDRERDVSVNQIRRSRPLNIYQKLIRKLECAGFIKLVDIENLFFIQSDVFAKVGIGDCVSVLVGEGSIHG